MMVVGREHRVVWISEGYKRVLPALGFAGAHEFVGQRIERVVPNTLLAQVIETGQAILADLLTNQADSFLVSRVPLRDAQSRVAGTGSTVLLLGETGTGKELLAQGIHAASVRAVRHFVGLNIAAVLDTPLEAEFFGVAPGAYTGADRKGRDGKFKLADGGTLFLDEIGNRPLQLQAKLLRALQEQEVEPLGSNQVQKVDVRVIAATRRDLVAMVADGRFRADLYYRLNVLPSACRRCASAWPTSSRWPTRCSTTSRAAVACRTGACRPRPWTGWPPMPGPAISASCAMCWSRPR